MTLPNTFDRWGNAPHTPDGFIAWELMRRHNLPGLWRTSSSNHDTVYLDGIGMLLADPDFWRSYFNQHIGAYTPVATGRSGAFLLGLLGRGILWNGEKPHGIEWANYPRQPINSKFPPIEGTGLPVVLVDDCTFTGRTFIALRAACARQNLVVVDQVAAWPFRE